MIPQATLDHYRAQLRLAGNTTVAVRRLWARMGDNFDDSWRTVGPRLRVVTAAGQLSTAASSVPYLPAVLTETGQPNNPVAALRARGFAGVAADGRPLGDMLYGAVIDAKKARREMSTVDALARGGRWLDGAIETTIADTGRAAVSTQIAARPDLAGYVRSTGPNACSRCRVLSGKFYRYSAGFARHNRCHCVHVPSSQGRATEFIADDTKVHSADLSSVSLASGSREVGRRLMPEQILTKAAGRDQAISLLRRAGYLVA